MYLRLSELVRQRVRDEVRERFGVELDSVSVELPPRTQLGDMAVPVAFELARRRLGKPRELAEALSAGLEALAGVARVELAGAGYLNLFLDRSATFRSLHLEVAERRRPSEVGRPGKTVVEHTNINPNKAAHIGHLRNAVLGDTLVRVLRYVGESVEAQNYIDDTGVQVADVVVGFEDLERLELEQVRALPEPFDHYCWDLYARVGRYYAEDEARLEHRSRVLRAIEEGSNPTAELASHIANRVVRRHLGTMARIGVRYDLLAWEGDVLRTDLWSHAFRKLRETEAVHRPSDGKNAGCWVMRLAGAEGFEDLEEPDKVLVRSDGTATYVAKDIAYQMWKFGLLGADFHYARLDDTELWSTTSQPGETPPESFGRADRVVNVIDTRQSYLQAIVAEGLRALGHSQQAERSTHFSYEMVALTPACAGELGIELSAEDRGRPFVEMSGRKGLGIKADDLMDKLRELAMAEVAERHPELDAEALGRLADVIAMGSLRYFMLRFSRNKLVAFDFKEALNFRGETGAYLQNAVVRARSIFRKLAQQEGRDLADPRAIDAERELTDTSELEGEDDLWDLVLGLSRLDDVLQAALSQLELSVLARYAFQMAQKFHRVYDRYRVMGQPPGPRRLLRAAIISLYLTRMTEVLDLMGIQVPERM